MGVGGWLFAVLVGLVGAGLTLFFAALFRVTKPGRTAQLAIGWTLARGSAAGLLVIALTSR